MMRIAHIIVLLASPFWAGAQLYKADSGTIKFFSEAPLEDIEAVSTGVRSAFDPSNGDIAFSVSMRTFEFDKSLMQEHFNERYVESDKYPNSTLKGKVSGFDTASSSVQTVTCSGELTIHGVTKNITVEGTMLFSGERLKIESVFEVAVKDFEIEIPRMLWQNIAEVVEVTITIEYVKI